MEEIQSSDMRKMFTWMRFRRMAFPKMALYQKFVKVMLEVIGLTDCRIKFSASKCMKNLKTSTANFPWDALFPEQTMKQVYHCCCWCAIAMPSYYHISCSFSLENSSIWWFFNDLPLSIYVSHSLYDAWYINVH